MFESWKILAAALVSLASILLYRHFKDPLRSIPGPFLAKLSGVWVLLIDLMGQRCITVHHLHQKYGHVVRVAPGELCFTSPQALKDIYGANSKLPKARVYETFGFKSTFNTVDRHDYRHMKKRIQPSFSPSFVAGLEPIVHRQVSNLIKCFSTRVDAPLDVLPWFRMLALSVVGESFADKSFGGLESEKTPELLHEMDIFVGSQWIANVFPTLKSILLRSPFKNVRDFLGSPQRFKKHCETAYREYLANHDPKTRDDIIARFVNERSTLAEKDQPIPRHITETGTVEEVTNLIFAGTDTTGNSLTYLFWELAHHPEWQLRLREESKQACGEKSNPDYAVIAELPILDAVVSELMRLWPAAPSALPRVTPEGGATIDGVFVPANVIVSCQALTEHRNPVIFPEPERFDPQRWIGVDKANEDAMREQILLFGKGARTCLGRRMALMEIKIATTAIVKNFNVEIGSEETDRDMSTITDHFVLIPGGGKCVLRLSTV